MGMSTGAYGNPGNQAGGAPPLGMGNPYAQQQAMAMQAAYMSPGGPMQPPGMMEGGYGAPMDGGPMGPGCPDEGCPEDVQGPGHFCGILGNPACFGLWNQSHNSSKLWFRGEYLYWLTKGNPLPPLVTTSFPGTPQSQAGVLGAANTSILFGNERVDQSLRPGGRLTVGYWFDEGQFNGIEAHYLALTQASTTYSNAQNFSTNPNAEILARPFFNTQTGMFDSSILAFPNFNLLGTLVNLNGNVNVQTTANMQSAGALFRHLMWVDFEANYRLDLLCGYRFLKLDDSVAISDQVSTVGGLLAPTTFTAFDSFAAHNTFNGGEIGLNLQYYWRRVSFDFLAKSAFGGNHEQVVIQGNSTVTTLGNTVHTNGGLLTQPSNIGTYGRTVFACLPEAAFNVRLDVNCHLRLLAGYDFMFLTRMQQSGSAIDLSVNPTQIGGGTLVGVSRPTFIPQDSGGWFAQGFTSGLEYRW